VIVLGIDPGYDRCGWAVVQKNGRSLTAIGYGCIQTSKTQSKLERMGAIWDELTAVLAKVPIDIIAMESLIFARNVSTALPVSEVRGLVIALAWQRQLQVAEYPPSTIKVTITGYGQADKEQVYTMLEKQIKLEKKPKLDDTGDALAVAVTHLVTQAAPRTL
jgi:crossover junction endodeoxyribonuclease RuvC